MNLIPVIDIARGYVVHARGGIRENYQPLQSILCRTCEPLDVVCSLLDLYPFTRLYIADLDAIQGHPVQSAILRQLHEGFPELELWVDAGIRDAGQIQSLQLVIPCTPVLGSETLSDTILLEQAPSHSSTILSLDFQGGSLRGPAALLATPALWPGRVIAMTLDRVGEQLGPDLEHLRKLRAMAPSTHLYAAGGAGSAEDLCALQAIGCTGVLLASALHDGRLTASLLADTARQPH